MTRRHVAAVIIVVWIGVMGWLVKSQYFRPRAELLAEAALNISPTATFYRLDLGDQQIGYASSQVDTLQDTIRLLDQMLLRIPALGSLQRVEARTDANLSRTLQLRTFTATLRGEDVRFGVAGRVSGDTLLQMEIQSAESTQEYEIRLTDPVVLPALLPLSLAFGGELAVGKTYAVRLFDPLPLAERDVDITVLAESTFVVPDSAELLGEEPIWVAARWDTVHAWQVRQEMGGFQVEAWIDDLGQIVQATTPMGFTMERTAYEIAFENFIRREPPAASLSLGADLIRQTATASNVPLASEELSELSIRLGGVDVTAFDLSGGRQELRGDTLIIQRESGEQLESNYFIPASGGLWPRYLAPEPLVQSDDPRIQAQARQIIGRERHPEHAAEQLVTWVHEELEKRITVSVPSALEVLATRRGDCNEHTVLYVALARAVGLPARTAAGLVYVDGRFYYHAWPEVYIDGWVAVDPTFGQFPADASHLRFTIGGLARQVELIQLIGRLSLDVVDTKVEE
jgi:transglutaminase-like putative cysteine protease